MTRRIVVTIVVTVLATLVVSGATTLLIARSQARTATESDLREQAEALASAAKTVNEDTGDRSIQQAAVRRALRTLRRAMRVDGIEFTLLDADGLLVGALPDGLTAADLDVDALERGETDSGANGSLVFAAAPAALPRTIVVAVVTRTASPGLAPAARWFAIAAATTLALAAAVAGVLARRIARPIRQASEVGGRIAAGELTTRLPEPRATDHDELAELARSLNAMATSLERSRTLEQQFLLSVSHDLRTPMTSIRGYAEAIVDGASQEPQAAAQVILAESARLERLVADLLDLARLDSASFSLHPVEHDLRATVAAAIRALAPNAANSGLDVRFDSDTMPIIVTADPDRVAQILSNLLENAGSYARQDIVVRVTAEGDRAIVTVDDDGPGIDPTDLPHVFDRLYSARHAPSRAEVGSGLGLAIVRQLAEAMGGSVRASASPKGGARVEVVLPLAAGTSDACRSSAAVEPRPVRR